MFMANVMAWQTMDARAARLSPLPERLHPALRQTLHGRGIDHLYSHQAEAVDLAMDGANVAVVTPTASGKTLCYNLPVLQSLLDDPNARALYLFPTKALAQDQLAELNVWKRKIEEQRSKTEDLPGAEIRGQPDLRSSFFDLSIATYDGDTPSAQRAGIRRNARIILSNPDMLHVGVMPYHPNWAEFLGGLRVVVIDEMHVYRGVFGSHMANVLRRLRRICALYGSEPQFICTSATIANPGQLAEQLIERPVTVVDDNGAPSGDKHIVLYNPPITDHERGLRRSSTLETQDLATRCILGGVQTIVFGRSRLVTEVLLSYLQERVGGEGRGARSEISDVERGGRNLFRRRSNVAPRPSTLAPRSAAIAAATCRLNDVPSRRVCAVGRCRRWWRPMRWSWASTLGSCRRRCSAAIRAASPARGSRWAGPGARPRQRWPFWWRPAACSISTSSRTRAFCLKTRRSTPLSTPTT